MIWIHPKDVEAAAQDLIRVYGLKVVAVSDHEVVLRGNDWGLYARMDHDHLLYVSYIDLRHQPYMGYNFSRLLYDKRGDRLTFDAQEEPEVPLAKYAARWLPQVFRNWQEGLSDLLGGDLSVLLDRQVVRYRVSYNVLKALGR